MNITKLPDVPDITVSPQMTADLIREKTALPLSMEFNTYLEKVSSFEVEKFLFTPENLVGMTKYFDSANSAHWGYNYDFVLKQEAQFLLPSPLNSTFPVRNFLLPIERWKNFRIYLGCPCLIFGLLAALFFRLMQAKSDIDLAEVVRITFSGKTVLEMEKEFYFLITGGGFDDFCQ